MAIKRRNRISLEFSAASMTDLIFLLLLFFMLTSTTLVAPNALKLLLPHGSNRSMTRSQAVVSITKDYRYYVDKTPVTLDQLEPMLRKKLAGTDKPVVAVHADRSVAIEYVVNVMNIARNNNFTVILATAPVEQK